eukprot:TRINITY_DN3884_c0_g1_i2.p1 TRINITY_DN3884_c0_g1~~TRINITY_DN3884_c0_g1_i2.p1  ORF type:complete len:233 (-),score=27.01 TRINITY_DN3884_c0_g1_i2:24-722(-)
MALFVKKPTEAQISEFLEDQRDSKLNYSFSKATLDHHSRDEFTRDERFKLFDIDQHRIKLGSGEQVFRKAVEGLRSWKQFSLDWVELHHPDTPIAVGSNVAIFARTAGVWTASACRIVYVVDDISNDPLASQMAMQPASNVKRYGFAYGSLDKHVEKGEERFLIEWNTVTNDVTFDILAFSQPGAWFTKLGYPVARWVQDTFAKAALDAMKAWVTSSETHSDQHGKQELQIV